MLGHLVALVAGRLDVEGILRLAAHPLGLLLPLAGCLNLVGAFLSVQVAKTISGGLVDETLITTVMIFARLVGAIMSNLMTWLVGRPPVRRTRSSAI